MLTPADLILGPPGIFPPDPVGARVVCGGAPWIVRHASDDEVWLVGERRRALVCPAECRLDLSPPHRLDAPARTLWDILHLGEQPPTAPWWGRSVRSSWGPGWTLRLPGFTGDATTISIFSRLEAPADSEGDVCVEDADGYIVCTAAAEEEDPRQALALTLAAVAESRR